LTGNQHGEEGDDLEAVRILGRPATITWDYDEDADVLYLSIGEPQPAVGLDIDEGVVLRYDEVTREVGGAYLDWVADTAGGGPDRSPLTKR